MAEIGIVNKGIRVLVLERRQIKTESLSASIPALELSLAGGLSIRLTISRSISTRFQQLGHLDVRVSAPHQGHRAIRSVCCLPAGVEKRSVA